MNAGINNKSINIASIMDAAQKLQTHSVAPFKKFQEEIYESINASLKEYIKEYEIPQEDFIKNAQFCFFENTVNGHVKYRNKIILRFGKDPTNELCYLISEDWKQQPIECDHPECLNYPDCHRCSIC